MTKLGLSREEVERRLKWVKEVQEVLRSRKREISKRGAGKLRGKRVMNADKYCELCNKRFTDQSKNCSAKFCSVSCRNRVQYRLHKDAWKKAALVYRESNREAIKDRNRKWNADNPENRKERNDRRRALNKAAFVSRVSRPAIYARDNYTCQLCGKKVNMKKKYPDPLSPSLDHILPLSKGGTHEPRNVQLAHFGCNARKNNVGVDQLRLFGE